MGLISPNLGTIITNMKDSKHNLADALFPKVRQQVLGILYSQPDRRFYSNEIIRITGSGRGAVQRELERLTDVGLIIVELVGRQKMYSANPNSPLFNSLKIPPPNKDSPPDDGFPNRFFVSYCNATRNLPKVIDSPSPGNVLPSWYSVIDGDFVPIPFEM